MTVLREAWRRSPWLTALALAHGALLAALLIGVAVDDMQVLGINRWIKPAKFAASIALYLGSLAWYAPDLGDARARRWAYVTAGTTMVIEMVAITMQAARGMTSHYNIATLLDAVVFQTMGIAIALNTVAMARCALLAWRRYVLAPSAWQLGITLGLAIAILGSLIGPVMVVHNAHTMGAADGGPGLPFVNWSTVAGDLRIAHFIGLHALQGLPLIAALWGRRAVLIATGLWSAFTLATLVQALAGRPLLAV